MLASRLSFSLHLLKKVDENFTSRGSLVEFFYFRHAALYCAAVAHIHKYACA